MEEKYKLSCYQSQSLVCHVCIDNDFPCCLSHCICYCDLILDLSTKVNTKQVDKFIELCSSEKYPIKVLYDKFINYEDINEKILNKLMKEYKK